MGVGVDHPWHNDCLRRIDATADGFPDRIGRTSRSECRYQVGYRVDPARVMNCELIVDSDDCATFEQGALRPAVHTGSQSANASMTGFTSGIIGYKMGQVTPASMNSATFSRHCAEVPTAIRRWTSSSGMRCAALR